MTAGGPSRAQASLGPLGQNRSLSVVTTGSCSPRSHAAEFGWASFAFSGDDRSSTWPGDSLESVCPSVRELLPKFSWVVLKLVSCRLSCAASLLSGMLGSLGEQLRPVPGLCGIYQGHLRWQQGRTPSKGSSGQSFCSLPASGGGWRSSCSSCLQTLHCSLCRRLPPWHRVNTPFPNEVTF